MMEANVEDRLLAKAERNYLTGCLHWTGGCSEAGYGMLCVNGRSRATHRVAYETWIGPIPDGLVIDHSFAAGCRYHDCIEPMHLEAVTRQENSRRAGKFHKLRHGGPGSWGEVRAHRPMPSVDPNLLTLAEVARYFAVGLGTARRIVHDMPVVLVGRQRRFKASDVRAFVASGGGQ